ncbi:hypothetical protein [Streptomyces sp. NBC_00690]|uniref:hypothetical protein n=1 Tax=Streptomyces sp. NBC_00690 TaxID=2975808 RepID=UPI002E2A6E8D|nr:hypothetical protein [Streptomyces sp. NBC_00690]
MITLATLLTGQDETTASTVTTLFDCFWIMIGTLPTQEFSQHRGTLRGGCKVIGNGGGTR